MLKRADEWVAGDVLAADKVVASVASVRGGYVDVTFTDGTKVRYRDNYTTALFEREPEEVLSRLASWAETAGKTDVAAAIDTITRGG